MARHGDELLHFVELSGLHDQEIVLLRVDDLGLQGDVEFIEVDCGRRGLQGLEAGQEERRNGHPDLQVA